MTIPVGGYRTKNRKILDGNHYKKKHQNRRENDTTAQTFVMDKENCVKPLQIGFYNQILFWKEKLSAKKTLSHEYLQRTFFPEHSRINDLSLKEAFQDIRRISSYVPRD